MKQITVLQGQCKVSDDPNVQLTTVLGSCVAVCLFDSFASVGGMNHFLLPGDINGGGQKDMRYGVNSMELLINDLLKRGALRRRFEAKLFGGASVIKNRSHIGKSNAEFAKTFLQREGIPITAEHLGGTAARRLKFSPTTGRVEHFVVPTTSDIEKPAIARAAPPPPKPDVTLF